MTADFLLVVIKINMHMPILDVPSLMSVIEAHRANHCLARQEAIACCDGLLYVHFDPS